MICTAIFSVKGYLDEVGQAILTLMRGSIGWEFYRGPKAALQSLASRTDEAEVRCVGVRFRVDIL
jgi:hypothetical protein